MRRSLCAHLVASRLLDLLLVGQGSLWFEPALSLRDVPQGSDDCSVNPGLFDGTFERPARPFNLLTTSRSSIALLLFG